MLDLSKLLKQLPPETPVSVALAIKTEADSATFGALYAHNSRVVANVRALIKIDDPAERARAADAYIREWQNLPTIKRG